MNNRNLPSQAVPFVIWGAIAALKRTVYGTDKPDYTPLKTIMVVVKNTSAE